MGIAGSIVNESFFQDWLGMRNENVDMSEFTRRMARLYDPRELERALAWVKKLFREGADDNAPQLQHSRQQKDAEWGACVKMALIARDRMVGNPRLEELGYGEEALGHNALAAGFQGQRQWTDHFPSGDFMETILNSSFDWNGIRQPYLLASENDSLNGAAMLFGHLLTGTAQIFSDVRTYWSPEAVRRVTGAAPKGAAEGGFIHLINSGSTALDGTGQMQVEGRPGIKPFWEVSPEEAGKCLQAPLFRPADLGYFRGGGFSTDFISRGDMPVTMSRLNWIKSLGPALQIAEGHTVELPEKMHDTLDRRTNPTWPTTWFVPRLTGAGPFRDVYSVMAAWGATTGRSASGILGRTWPAWLPCCASRCACTTPASPPSGRAPGRPSAWTRKGQTTRACAAYGPLYG